MYLDRLLAAGKALDWGICAVDVLPSDRPKERWFAEQDGLYTLMIKEADGTISPRVIGSLADHLYAPEVPELVLGRLTDPRTRIVTLTITEGGYSLHPVSGEFDPQDPAVAHDLLPGVVPRSVFGFITESLRRRRAAGVPAFTVVSCDNLQGNGKLARRVFSAFAERADPEFGQWVRDHVSFPNSMVDRITPVTTAEDTARLGAEFGIEDAWPVVCEPFAQWVLEDQFPAGRPPWEDSGVQLVADVTPYELMKLRLLNASHQALCYPGTLVGYTFVHEVTSDPLFAQFLLDYMIGEAIGTLRPVPGVDLRQYAHQLIERFSNPEVRDTVARLCNNASDLIPKFLLPVIRHQLAAGQPFTRSAAVVASWARYCEGTNETGAPHVMDDDLAPQLAAAAARQRSHPTAFLTGNRGVFGELADDSQFTRVYTAILASLFERGVRRTFASLDRFDPLTAASPQARLEGESC
jgi:mannitol 2-dehydrogenase